MQIAFPYARKFHTIRLNLIKFSSNLPSFVVISFISERFDDTNEMHQSVCFFFFSRLTIFKIISNSKTMEIVCVEEENNSVSDAYYYLVE